MKLQKQKNHCSITVTAEGLTHAHNARIPPAAHAHNLGFRDFCAPDYAQAHNRKNMYFIFIFICILFFIFVAIYQLKKF